MKLAVLLALVILAPVAQAEDCPVNLEPMGPINAMTQSNPGYKARAGGSYEEHMLGPALAQFVEMAEAGPHYDAVKCAVRVHIYDWLDMYCRNNGTRDDGKHRELAAVLDGRLTPFLPDGRQQAYESWKAENPLNFLMFDVPESP